MPRKVPEFRRGDLPRAADLDEWVESIRRNRVDAEYPLWVGPDNVVRVDRDDWFWAKIVSGTNPYAWVEQSWKKSTSEWIDRVDGRSGTAEGLPAYEANAAADVTAGEVVKMYPGYHGLDYRFRRMRRAGVGCEGAVCVTVKGCWGNILVGAEVTVTGADAFSATCTTGLTGRCCVTVPPDGDYDVTAAFGGMVMDHDGPIVVTITGCETVDVEVVLDAGDGTACSPCCEDRATSIGGFCLQPIGLDGLPYGDPFPMTFAGDGKYWACIPRAGAYYATDLYCATGAIDPMTGDPIYELHPAWVGDLDRFTPQLIVCDCANLYQFGLSNTPLTRVVCNAGIGVGAPSPRCAAGTCGDVTPGDSVGDIEASCPFDLPPLNFTPPSAPATGYGDDMYWDVNGIYEGDIGCTGGEWGGAFRRFLGGSDAGLAAYVVVPC